MGKYFVGKLDFPHNKKLDFLFVAVVVVLSRWGRRFWKMEIEVRETNICFVAPMCLVH